MYENKPFNDIAPYNHVWLIVCKICYHSDSV